MADENNKKNEKKNWTKITVNVPRESVVQEETEVYDTDNKYRARIESKEFKYFTIKEKQGLLNVNLDYKVPFIGGEVLTTRTADNFEDFCRLIVNHVKDRIGIDHDNLDKFLTYMNKKGIDDNKILKEVLSEEYLNMLLKKSNIKSNYLNTIRAKRFLLVVALALLKCVDYECLRDNIVKLATNRYGGKIDEKQARRDIKRYIPLLKNINPDLKVNQWLPSRDITYQDIKELVENVGLQKTEVKGILLKPESEKEFKTMREKLRLNKKQISDMPLKVKCGKCGFTWDTMYLNMYRHRWNCKFCRQKIYNFDDAKKSVEDIGLRKTGSKGILLKPKTKKDFETLRVKLKVIPSRVPLWVRCGNCGSEFPTNIDRITQDQWCIYCQGKGVYNYIRAKKLVEGTGLTKTGKKGVLIYPKSQKEFEDSLEEIKKRFLPKYPLKAVPGKVPLRVQCAVCKEEFDSNAAKLRQNFWCLTCSSREYEQIIRWYLSKILSYICQTDSRFRYKSKLFFPTTPLSRLIRRYNINNYTEQERQVIKNLITRNRAGGHLDGYEEIFINGVLYRIGLEYNGGQHYKLIEKFHNSIDDLEYQQLRDNVKMRLCVENNIFLIIFRYDYDERMNHPSKIQNALIEVFERVIGIELDKNTIPQFNHLTPEFGQYRLDNYLNR